MYTYILCQFDYGYEGQFYQEVENGNVIRLVDLDGNTMSLPDAGETDHIAYGYFVVDAEPARPSWAEPLI